MDCAGGHGEGAKMKLKVGRGVHREQFDAKTILAEKLHNRLWIKGPIGRGGDDMVTAALCGRSLTTSPLNLSVLLTAVCGRSVSSAFVPARRDDRGRDVVC